MAKRRVRDYRDLDVWKQAIELALLAEKVCDRLPRKAWNLASQMRRAANSVHSNIAEGNGRFSRPDYLRHLSMSNASLRELESDLYFVSRKYGRRSDVLEALELAPIVAQLLAGLVRSLRNKKDEDHDEEEEMKR
jgi:four helix bundle protein